MMRTKLPLALLLVCVSFVADESCFGLGRKTPLRFRHLPKPAALEEMKMDIAWDLVVETSGDVYAVHVLPGLVVLQTRPNGLYAVDSKAGVLKWQRRLPYALEYAPASNGDTVFVVSGGTLFALASYNGRTLWRKKLDFTATGGPAATPSVVAVPGRYLLHAFETADGAFAWRFRTRGRINVTPSACKPCFCVGDSYGWIYCLLAPIGQLAWERQTWGEIRASAFAASPTVYAGSTDFKIYACDMMTGAPVWEKSLGNSIVTQPILSGDYLYAWPYKTGLVVLGAADGSEKWRAPDARKLLAVGKTKVYMLTGGNQITAFDRFTGRRYWSVKDERHRFFPTNLCSNLLFMVSKEGAVVALKEK